jgi:hypothetical protein
MFLAGRCAVQLTEVDCDFCAFLCLPYVLLCDCAGTHHLQAENGGSSQGGLRPGTTGGRSEWVGDPKRPMWTASTFSYAVDESAMCACSDCTQAIMLVASAMLTKWQLHEYQWLCGMLLLWPEPDATGSRRGCTVHM